MDYGNLIKLLHELRLSVLDLATPREEWERIDPTDFLENVFPGSLGDPNGSNFPLSYSYSALVLNKWIRREALPFAYRSLRFRFDDMDDFIKFAVSIGQIGRKNVESLELIWMSSCDMEAHFPKEGRCLPSIHVSKCVQLLKQLKRLKYLRLVFDEQTLSTTPFEDFKSDFGIRELSSFRGPQVVEFWGIDEEHLDRNYDCAKWLKQILEH